MQNAMDLWLHDTTIHRTLQTYAYEMSLYYNSLQKPPDIDENVFSETFSIERKGLTVIISLSNKSKEYKF